MQDFQWIQWVNPVNVLETFGPSYKQGRSVHGVYLREGVMSAEQLVRSRFVHYSLKHSLAGSALASSLNYDWPAWHAGGKTLVIMYEFGAITYRRWQQRLMSMVKCKGVERAIIKDAALYDRPRPSLFNRVNFISHLVHTTLTLKSKLIKKKWYSRNIIFN